MRQVVVYLLDELWVRVEASGGPKPALELYKGIQRREVNGAARSLGRRILLHHLIGLDQPRDDEKVPHRGGDVGLGLAAVVSSQDFGGGLGVFGVVVVYLFRHWLTYGAA